MSELREMPEDEHVSGDPEDEDESSCPVCMERRPPREMCRLRCRHLICARCMPQLQIGRCPICRESIYPPRDDADPLSFGSATANILGIVGERISLADPQLEPSATEAPGVEAEPSSVDDLLRFSLQEFMDHVRNDTGGAPLVESSLPGTLSAAGPPLEVEVPLRTAVPRMYADRDSAPPGSGGGGGGVAGAAAARDSDGDSDRDRLRVDDLAMVILCRSGSLRNTVDSLRTLFLSSPPG